jgi:peptidoglycan/xylan/chitin deacetylase (PgdA/CDA1 family)
MLVGYLLLASLIVLIVFLIFWNIDARYYFGLPDLKFREDENVNVGMYPDGFKTAFLFSCDDLSAKTDKKNLVTLLETLDKYHVKGTFFTIPRLEGKYPIKKDLVETVLRRGHEIAQHGFTHHWKRNSKLPIISSLEFRGLNNNEQEQRISEGKKILNLNPLGFRTSHFSSNEGTLELLTKDDFLYNSDVRIRPEGKITNKRFLGIVYGSIYFPYFWTTRFGRILIIPANGDYTWSLKTDFMEKSALIAARNRFNKFYNKGGVFCLLTHLHPRALPGKRGMSFLDSFLQHVTEKGGWAPTMLDFAKWWSARQSLKVVTYIRRGTLVVKLEKPSKYPLKGLILSIKVGKEYEILYDGKIKSGIGPEKITIDV